MKLSIITVNLNNRDGLQKTIDSVICQSFKDFEWIVIDGGSTDGSKELIEQYADHFAYWVSEPDKGIYNAMNKGIRVAKGEYLQFLNSGDCLCTETILEKCFAYNFRTDFAYCNVYLYDKDQTKSRVYPDSLTLRFFINDTLCHNGTFIKREIIQSTYYNETLTLVSDWEFFLVQLLKKKSYIHINEFLTFYDMNGLSSTNGESVLKERENVIKTQIPQTIMDDYRYIDVLEVQLSQKCVKKVMELSGKKKLYRKIINACLRLIEMVDKVSTKKEAKC